MTHRSRADDGDDDDLARSVAEYLRANPDFLTRFPDLAGRLEVVHDAGPAVSLVHYQLRALRQRTARASERLDALMDNARYNEEVSRRLHVLVLALLDTDRLDELFTVLYQSLESTFDADFVALQIYGDARSVVNRGLAEFAGSGTGAHPDHRPPGAVAPVLARGEPHCGRGAGEALEALFGERAPHIESACLLPFHCGASPALLAIASRSRDRFHAAMGTHYLRQLAELLGALVEARR